MTKKTKHGTTVTPPMPFVSVCTPTYNRRPFIPIIFECFRNQKYPKYRLEWIIVDDGTDKIQDLVEQSKIPQIKYFPIEQKMTLGTKRNFMNEKCKGSIIVYMDDDDYYPPERISHAVEKLQANPHALCAGASEIYIYFKHIQKMYQFGPYGPNHATAATFAFRRELLNTSCFENNACVGEEQHFLKNYTVPFVQLEPTKTILVFSHEHNSCDKRKFLENNNNNPFQKESHKTVDMFIRNASENIIKQFFMNDIDNILSKYEAGEPKMKPDVLKQIKTIDEDRKKQAEQMMSQQNQMQQIMVQEPGKEPVPISIPELINIMNKQQQQLIQDIEHIKNLEQKINDLENHNTSSKKVKFLDTSSRIKELESLVSELESSLKDAEKTTAELESRLKNAEKTAVYENVSKIKKIKNSFANAISMDTMAQPKTDPVSNRKMKNEEKTVDIQEILREFKKELFQELKREFSREHPKPELINEPVLEPKKIISMSKTDPEIKFKIVPL